MIEKVQECGKLMGGEGQLRDGASCRCSLDSSPGGRQRRGKDSETRQFPGGAGGTLISFLFRNFLFFVNFFFFC